ncbi:GTPase IMAP family member 1-like [Solea senegalensis]|uniref:GTPase IMAP family member 1-like n=1 Tax=Solea senegalensis TaxID=28829 RepID=A0AAV6RP20_SOLSE|nr:immune-associated nucleotide-binding protein 1-like isoform X1 [Solea senegalensis]KAG7507228.1 GTPase IMAP family member 1-like [Solea senegalensis]
MECQCEKDNAGEAVAGWWMGTSNVQLGAFTVVGYLLYRFSQTLPALIRWPIRLFCSLTGLSALWSWVGRLVGTIRGIQNLFKFLSRAWRFIVRISHKFKWLSAVIKAITGSSGDEAQGSVGSGSPRDPGLRLILLGPSGGGRTSLANTLLGSKGRKSPVGPLMESTKSTAVVDGREVTVVDTPDLLGPSLGGNRRAKEALRSLQLVSPGPHAVLLVLQAPHSGRGINQDAHRAIQATMELFGDDVLGHIIPVLTHADLLGQKHTTVDQLLDVDTDLRRTVSLCGQRPELVDDRPDCPPEAQRTMSRQLVGRVMEMKELRGHFVHKLQRREERFREELLTDMASALARKLGHM